MSAPPLNLAPFLELDAVADVMRELGDQIEALGVTLCLDPEIAARHGAALQAFDLIAQKQRGLALLLRADCPVSALAAVGLDELAARLGSPFADLAAAPPGTAPAR